MAAIRLIGMDKVLRKLTKEVNQLSERVEGGMIAAGQYIQAEAQANTPVDTGALRASARTTWEKGSGSIKVCVSYGQYYSIFVHERKARHAVGDWKYLERAITENWDQIIAIMAKNSRLRA